MMKTAFFIICLTVLTTSAIAQIQKIKECIIDNGVLKTVDVDYNTATGERTITVGGVIKKFYELYPQDGKEYAARAIWFINSEPVTFKGASFVKYGLPRVLSTFEITRNGAYKGVGVYTQSGLAEEEIEVIYIPVRSGCEFQPYQKALPPCATVTIKANKEKPKQGDTIVFTATLTGAIPGTAVYEWYIDKGKVIGSNEDKTLTLSTTGTSGELFVYLTVTIEGVRCAPASGTLKLQVNK